MIDVSEFALTQEVPQQSEELIIRRQQVRTVLQMIKQLPARFNQLPLCQFYCNQPCIFLEQNEISVTST
ncbi:hypothetical protein KIN20_011394 [Parelaphostrongylus tenuis]|uniref:Uncharacterized protein n=1 Tax=Parelaphostrongylus tenuis TaxID=148309 RepID=A0AAD5M9B8_PARTN|nr:hypothetical protein KIN20_011394 [Parelaphostrongylus tenuis]